MTRPRTPRSEMTTLLPRPRTKAGIALAPGVADRPRSSNALWAVANRSADPPTRIVVNRASGASRSARTPRRRAISAASSDGVERPRQGAQADGPRRQAVDRVLGRERSPQRQRHDHAATPSRARVGRGPGQRPPSRGARPASFDRRDARQQGAGIEVHVVDQPGRTGLGEDRGICLLVATGVRIRDHDHWQAEGRGLGQGRRAGPTDQQVGRGKRRQQPLAEEGRRSIPLTQRLGQRLAGDECRGVAGVARHVDEVHPLDEARQGRGDGLVEPADRLGPTEHQDERLAFAEAEGRPGRSTVDGSDIADRRPRLEARPARLTGRRAQRRTGLAEGDGDGRRQAGGRTNAPAGDDVALPDQCRDTQEPRPRSGRGWQRSRRS